MATVETRFTTAGVAETQGACDNVAKGFGNVSDASKNTASSLDFLRTAAISAVSALASLKLVQYGTEATMFAANIEQANRALSVISNTMGKSSEWALSYRDSLRDLNITTNSATNATAQFIKAGFPMEALNKLGTAAQGAAISYAMMTGETISSSQALDKMIRALVTGNVTELHTLGINVMMRDSLRENTRQTGEAALQVDTHQRKLLMLSDTLKKTEPLMLLYAKSTDLAAKQISSSKRPIEEMKLALGNLFLPELTASATAFYQTVSAGMKWVKAHTDEMTAVKNVIKDFADGLLYAVGFLTAYSLAMAIATATTGGFSAGAGIFSGALATMGMSLNLTGTSATVAATKIGLMGESITTSTTVARLGVLSLTTAFSILGAFMLGWEIGKTLSSKFETVRKAGVYMVHGLMTGWDLAGESYERFVATVNPFGNEEKQQAQLRAITDKYAAIKKTRDEALSGSLADAVNGSGSAATKPYVDDQAAIKIGKQKELDRLAEEARVKKDRESMESRVLAEKQAAYDRSVADAKTALAHTVSGNERKLEEANMQNRLKQLQFEHDTGLLLNEDYLTKKYAAEQSSREKELASVVRYQNEAQNALTSINKNPVTDLKMQLDAKKKLAEATGAVQIAQQKLDSLPAEHLRNRIKDLNTEYLALANVKNQLSSMASARSAQDASMVGVNPDTGYIDTLAGKEANALAVQQDAHKTRLAMIEEEKQAAINKWMMEEKSISNNRLVLGKLTDLEKQKTQADRDNTNKTTKISTDSYRSQLSAASQYTGMAGQFFSTLASTQDQSSRSGFESAKAFSIAAATMSTAAAVMNALATVQPYPMALAAAALAAATGVIQIAQIASTTFGGGGSVAAPPSGSFSSSGGGSTGSGAGSSVSAPLQSVHDQQTAAQLDKAASSMDNAAVAMGKASKTFLDIGELFKTGAMAMLMNIVPGKYTNTTDNSTSFVKDYYLGTGLKTQLGIALAPLKLLKGDFKGFLDALNPVNWVSDIGKGLFGGSWALSGAGITSQLVNGQYRVGSYTTEHKDGGLFGSDKDRTNYGNNVDPAFSKGMTQFFDGLKLNLLRGAASFGLSAVTTEAGFASANTAMGSVATAGRKPEDIQKDWEVQIQAASDSLTKTIPGLAELSLGGENATDTLARLSTAMMNVNDALALVGAALIPSAGVITDTAYQLQQLFGGAEEMATAMDDYFSAMYTDSEQSAMKAAAAQRTVNLGFSEINNTLAGAAIQIPKTNAEFNALRNSVTDPSLFAALTLLGPTFAEITKQAEELVATVTSFSVDLISRELKASGQSGLADLYDLKKQQELEMKDAITNGMDTQWLAIVQQKELDAVMKNSLDEAVKNVANAQKTLDDLAAKAHMDVMQTTSNALLKAAADLKSRLISILDIRTSATQTLITLLGGNLSLSTLYAQKKAEFERTRLLSESGDTAAMKALPEVVSSFVDVSKQYASSRSVFESDLASGKQALAVLAGIPATADLTLENARLQLLKLEEIREATSTGTVEQRSLLSDMSGGLTGMQSLLSDFLAATVSAQQSAAALAAAQAAATAAAAESSRLAALKAGQDAAAALLAQQREAAKLTKIEAYTTAKGAYAITSGGLIQQYRSGTLDETNFNTQNTSAYAPVQTAFDATVAAGITGLSAPSKLAIAAVDTAARLLDTYLRDKAVLDGYIARGVQAVKSNPYGVSPIIMLDQTNTVAADLEAYRSASRSAGLVPAYATGGDHFGGWRIVGENGPELEATGQSRIFNADQTRNILSNGQADNREMVGELKALRGEIKQLRSEQKAGNIAIAENTGKTARQLSRWDGDGTPPVRDAA